MKKILFVILASFLVFSVGCSSRAKAPKVSTAPGSSNQISQQQQQQQQQQEEEEEEPSGTPGITPPKNQDGITPPKGQNDTKQDQKEDSTNNNQTNLQINSDIEKTVNDWDGKSDHVPSGYTLKDVK